MSKLSKATSVDDVIHLIHPRVLEQIPENLLNEIAQNILDVERYIRGDIYMRVGDFTATRIYNYMASEITQIEYQDEIYKL